MKCPFKLFAVILLVLNLLACAGVPVAIAAERASSADSGEAIKLNQRGLEH